MTTRAVAPFSSANRLATWAQVLLLTYLVLSVISIFSGLLEINLLSRVESSGISDLEASANDLRQEVIGVLQFFITVSTAVVFLIWFYRVHKNLPSLGARGLKYSPAWAVGGFFVPILNFWRPLHVMQEVWHGSDPARVSHEIASEEAATMNQNVTPWLVIIWWILFLISSFLGRIILRKSFAQSPTIEQLQSLDYFALSADLLDVIAIPVTILLIAKITRWQAQRRDIIAQSSSDLLSATDPDAAVIT